MYIPQWWLIITGIFAIVALLFFAVLTYAVISLIGIVKKLEPKVLAITEKVDSIAAKVDDIAQTTKETLESVSITTKSIASTTTAIVALTAGPLKKVTPWLKYIGFGIKFIRMILSSQGNKKRRRKAKRDLTTEVKP